MKTPGRKTLPLCALALLLVGCGSDRPAYAPSRPPAAPDAAARMPLVAADAPSGGGDPLAASGDPLAGPSPDRTSDPLLGENGGRPKITDPLAGGDTLAGPQMPTQHSHWLRGRLHAARMTVSLNGVRQPALPSVIDQDITMRLRAGVNTVTFAYQPQGADSSATMEVVEGEHTPEIAPLVTFQPAPATDRASAPAPLTRTFTFVAR